MDKKELFFKVEEIFKDILDDEEFVLTEEASADTIEDWDSLFHITLIASIEDEFKVHFSTDDIVTMKKVSVLLEVLDRELNK